MHECVVAGQVLEAVLQRALHEGASRVRVVRGWVAEMMSLCPERLSFHFADLARGTTAEGARLLLEFIYVEARCRACGRTYAPEHPRPRCPVCGSRDGEQLGQTGLSVTALVVE